MKAFRADTHDGAMDTLIENALDVTGAGAVEVVTNKTVTGWIVHVNVNGVCLLRICRIKDLEVRLA